MTQDLELSRALAEAFPAAPHSDPVGAVARRARRSRTRRTAAAVVAATACLPVAAAAWTSASSRPDTLSDRQQVADGAARRAEPELGQVEDVESGRDEGHLRPGHPAPDPVGPADLLAAGYRGEFPVGHEPCGNPPSCPKPARALSDGRDPADAPIRTVAFRNEASEYCYVTGDNMPGQPDEASIAALTAAGGGVGSQSSCASTVDELFPGAMRILPQSYEPGDPAGTVTYAGHAPAGTVLVRFSSRWGVVTARAYDSGSRYGNRSFVIADVPPSPPGPDGSPTMTIDALDAQGRVLLSGTGRLPDAPCTFEDAAAAGADDAADGAFEHRC